ncbi:MAG: demethoxyubiquinone hydroxylase family protein [Clostridia bacterium]|nr:demethoxyubiquinone hydroxylase family protein [Clostridia bacterium]
MKKVSDEKFLKISQQGELDAVPMYLNIAKIYEKKNPELAGILKGMAADEGRHASVFKKISGDSSLRPKMLKAKAVPALVKMFGKKMMFKIIAKEEYKAYDMYAPWIEKFPEVASVQADEKRHGDLCMKIREM